jgi:hypothetical protein
MNYQEEAKALAKMVTGKVFFGSELQNTIKDFLIRRDTIMEYAVKLYQDELSRRAPVQPAQPVEAKPYDMDREVEELRAMIAAMPDDPPAQPEGGEGKP